MAMQLFAAGAIAGAFGLRLVISGDFDLVLRDVAGAVFFVIGVLVAWNRVA